MKLLFAVSSLDLKQPFGCTAAWWQLFKGLYEIGVEVIAIPYQGPALDSLWWRAEPNPAKLQGDVFKFGRDKFKSVSRGRREVKGSDATEDEHLSDNLVRRAAHALIAPVWARCLDRILEREPDVDAVIFLTVPLNHLTGVPSELRRKHNKPVFYYDGDLPASLPTMQGFATGFRMYHGADLSEYAAFIGNSRGAADALKKMHASAVHPLYWGADPDVFSPMETRNQDIGALFYGNGSEYREDWIDDMITAPSNALPQVRFATRGAGLGELGRAEDLPLVGFSKVREYACRSKINLCITRSTHATVYASSTSRPFELASMGACIVTNPYLGIEEWFEPGKEIFVVHSQEEAVDRYRHLLSHESERLDASRAARDRVLKQHTFRHRAHELVKIVQGYL